MLHDAILAEVERYYSERFAEHGASAQGVDWNSPESQERRFVQLARLFEPGEHDFSVNDLGCGYGAFVAFLDRCGFSASYTGYELSQAMLGHARSAFRGRPSIRFRHGSALRQADYSVASGIFNVKLTAGDADWTSYVWATIDELARASLKGFAFNMLTTYSDANKRRADLYYADPSRVFETCAERYSHDVALLHDYGLWEFTVIVRYRS